VSRPVTAYDRIRSRVAWEKHRSLVDEVNAARRIGRARGQRKREPEGRG